jgi:hypothetical protein
MRSFLLDEELAGSIATAPVVKHGDPSRPGYALLHPTGRHSITAQRDRVANALRTGGAMGLGWPAPPELKDAFDAAVGGPTSYYDMNPDGLIQSSPDMRALHFRALRFAVDSGMPGDDSPHGGKSSARIYAEAMVNRARMVRGQKDNAREAKTEGTYDSAVRAVQDVRKNGAVCVAVTSDAAERIFRDGRVKTQFEVGDSNGVLDPDYRAVQETAAFDHHPATPVRTVYGYVASRRVGIDVPTQGPAQYGQVRLELRPSARSMTSMTAGDSLGLNSTPVPMTGRVGERAAHAATGRVKIPQVSINVGRDLADIGPSEWSTQPGAYFEAQIHGTVTVDMIRRVHWGHVLPPSPSLRARLDAAGVEFVEYDPYDYEY